MWEVEIEWEVYNLKIFSFLFQWICSQPHYPDKKTCLYQSSLKHLNQTVLVTPDPNTCTQSVGMVTARLFYYYCSLRCWLNVLKLFFFLWDVDKVWSQTEDLKLFRALSLWCCTYWCIYGSKYCYLFIFLITTVIDSVLTSNFIFKLFFPSCHI